MFKIEYTVCEFSSAVPFDEFSEKIVNYLQLFLKEFKNVICILNAI